MPSTRIPRLIPVYAAQILLLLSMVASINGALNTMTYEGCYSSSQPLVDQGTYEWQTSGHCQPICVNQSQPVLGLSEGSHCWCGDKIPAANTKVADSFCNSPCDGYNLTMCGGNGYWGVYLSGIEANVPNYSGSSGTGSSTPSQTHATPSVVTSISPGKTVIVTETPAGDASGSPTPSSSSNSSSGPSVGGIAAGVAVGVLLILGAVAGIFFWRRHKNKSAAEEEYKRTQVADFMRNGKAPPTAHSQASDWRLDPESGNRRNSLGSIADQHDFSRKILRVANPDHSY